MGHDYCFVTYTSSKYLPGLYLTSLGSFTRLNAVSCWRGRGRMVPTWNGCNWSVALVLQGSCAAHSAWALEQSQQQKQTQKDGQQDPSPGSTWGQPACAPFPHCTIPQPMKRTSSSTAAGCGEALLGTCCDEEAACNHAALSSLLLSRWAGAFT